MNGKQLQKEIRQIQQDIANLGPLRPGALYQRGNVCGKAGCRCKRKNNPVPHGPYYYLSYTLKGKSHTEHVSARNLHTVREQIRNYKTLTKRVKELVELNIELAKLRKEEV